MKSSAKLLWTKSQQTASFLLMVLFLFISTAQLFHIHADKHSDQDVQFEDKDQIQSLDKCSICDYYHYAQGQQILLYYPTVLTIVNPEAITLNTCVLTGNYDFTPKIIANKGPPYFA
ncbi:hypothetical protein [Pedobacter hiemivivus]|uniref:Uncharacterized protein n=1 Tax=Pedobacter hiemivivus TaxID=2530454 RepID=A0A4R0NDP4_9SPHI|nr:hypothetical protein [Pedobacter hiemivivus]TCC98415.1 hypothetical protein EZ444_03765 [Pedobacter hiemivivus]